MPELDLQNLAVTIVAIASVLSLLFKFLKRLRKEVEAVGVVWIRAYKRIRNEMKDRS